MNPFLSWSDLKALASDKGLNLQYVIDTAKNVYKIFFFEGPVVYYTEILIGETPEGNQLDFETNHQADCNEVVETKIDEPRYAPRLAKQNTDIDLDEEMMEELVSITGTGKVDLLVLNFSKDDYEIIIEVDGVEAYRLKGEDEVKDIYNLSFTSENAELPYIGTMNGNKTYVESFPSPVDFYSSYKIKALKTTGSSVKFIGGIVRYRKKI